MMPHAECVVCSPHITPDRATSFCAFHRRIREYYGRNRLMLEALRKVSYGERSDFPRSSRSHIWHQLVGVQKSQHWVVELDDILRAYGVHYERERGAGHDESEAA